MSDECVTEQPTYIGKYSNLQRGDRTASPHGKALYQLTLRYGGKDREVVLSFPQLFSAYRIILDGTPIAEGKGSAKLSFTLTEGDHLLAVETTSSHGYYSGLYHPPMLGATNTMFQWILISCIAYGIGFSVPFALALFTLTLWRSSGDKPAFWFGMLCGCFSLYLSYYFVRLLALPFVEWWFLIQSAALYGLCFCVIRLTALAGGKGNTVQANWIQRILAGTSVVLLLLALLMPALPQSVRLHGLLFVQPKKMAILFENLIYNALRSMPLGGKITIAAELDENECHLTVADTGGGIPLDELPHIFRRFYVGKENKGIGSGLGLTIVKSIVDELHGEISVSSKPGQGAVFYIDLPLYRE